METFGTVLRHLRTGVGLSQSELAKRIGVSKSSINMYERGEREPSFETLEAIADFFNVDMDFLLGRTSVRLSHAGRVPISITVDTSEFSTQARPLIVKLCDAISRMASSGEEILVEVAEILREAQKTFTAHDSELLMAFIEFLGELYHNTSSAFCSPSEDSAEANKHFPLRP